MDGTVGTTVIIDIVTFVDDVIETKPKVHTRRRAGSHDEPGYVLGRDQVGRSERRPRDIVRGVVVLTPVTGAGRG